MIGDCSAQVLSSRACRRNSSARSISSPRAGLFHDRPFASRRQVSALSRKYVASIVHPRAVHGHWPASLIRLSISGSTHPAVTRITDCHAAVVTSSGVPMRRLFHAYFFGMRRIVSVHERGRQLRRPTSTSIAGRGVRREIASGPAEATRPRGANAASNSACWGSWFEM
jgi:hypothetical protein